MRWAQITVQCAPEAQDAVSYAFLEAGCGGVMLRGNGPITIEGSLPVLDDLMPRLDSLRTHLGRLEEFGLPALIGEMTLRYAEDEDWANAWRQYYKPMRVGKRLIIKPSWETYEPAPDELILELDPGMAFGTGGHPTTRLCLQALEDHLTPGARVADIGTGSGILAIAAARLGARQVFATDIDGLPRRVAAENVARNGLTQTVAVLEMARFDEAAQTCDLVVANIVANTIIELAPSIAARLVEGGLCIASGIVEEHHDVVRDALAATGFTLIDTLREDIWVALIARRDADRLDSEALAHAAGILPPVGAEWPA
jgi:ribosomal protein L11 methyltransferase